MPSITTGDLANAKVDVDHIGEIATSLSLTATDRLGHTKNTMAGAIATISAITNRGAWASAQTYVVKDLVSNAGTWYICIDPHTSGATFAGDVAHWRVYQGVLAADLAAPNGSALSGFVQSGTGAVTLTVQSDLRRTVRVTQFGAVGDGVTDDTAACQAAITYAKANGKRLHWPAGNYLVTLSLDCTFASNNAANFMMYGDGKGVTFITGILTELYPIIDYTGNTRGELRDMTVRSTGATSKATCAFLSAKPTAGSSYGNTVTVENCMLQVPTSGNANAVIGAVFYNTDLSKCINTECYGPAGATFGSTKPGGISSKFAGSSATVDSTLFIIEDSVFLGDSGVPLEYTGGACISLSNTYCAVVGGGTGGSIFRISGSGSYGNNITARQLRTENQSSATSVPAVYFKVGSTLVDIRGELNTDTSGVMFKSDAVNLINFTANVNGQANSLFSLGGGICRARITATPSGGAQTLGTIADVTQANTHDVEIRGGVTEASIISVLGAGTGMGIVQGAEVYQSIRRKLFTPGSTSQLLRPSACFDVEGIGTTAYTGGSGEQLVYSYVVKGAMLDSTNITPLMALVLELVGTTAAAAAINGRIRVNLLQGGGNVDILDTGANIPAVGAGNLRLTSKVYAVSGTASRAYCELQICPNAATAPVAFSKFTNTQATIVLNADFTLRVYVTNTGNSPYSFEVQTGLLT